MLISQFYLLNLLHLFFNCLTLKLIIMNKKFTLLAFMAVFSLSTFAGGGWATSAISITKDGGTAYSYPIDLDEGWTDGDWILNTEFNSFNFGAPASLLLNGGFGNGWTDDSPGYTTASFVLYYRVYKNGATPGSWSQIALDNLTYNAGNNYIYSKSNANVDILSLATELGANTYTLEVVMSKNQYYTGGNWNSMIPGGQATAYSASVAGYKATFSKSIFTDISKIESSLKISTESGKVTARFDGKADVQLFTSTGQLISSSTSENEFSKTVKRGVYLLRIDGKSHKVVVQ